MGNRNGENLTRLHVVEPRRQVGHNLGAHHAGGMTANLVVSQGRRSCIQVADFAIRHQAQLDQCLEAVADTKHQAITLLQQLVDSFLDARIPEDSRNKLAGAVRLVTAAETARQHNDLRSLNALDNSLHRLLNSLRRQVADNQSLRIAAGTPERPGRIILAVGSREDRNENLRLGKANLWLHPVAAGVEILAGTLV